MSAALKHCRKCGHDHPLTPQHWHRRAAASDGFQDWCKACMCAAVEASNARRERMPAALRYKRASKPAVPARPRVVAAAPATLPTPAPSHDTVRQLMRDAALPEKPAQADAERIPLPEHLRRTPMSPTLYEPDALAIGYAPPLAHLVADLEEANVNWRRDRGDHDARLNRKSAYVRRAA